MATNLEKSFLLATWEGGGSVTPILTVARKLRAAGHRVRVISDRCNRFEAEAAGAGFAAWTRAPSRPDRSRDSDVFRDWEAQSPPEQIGRVIDKIMTGPALAYAQDVMEELAREPADLVLTSEMLFGVMAGCEAAGQPFAIMTCNVNFFPMPGMPPVGPGLMPACTEDERTFHAEIAEANAMLFGSGLPALNAARATLGLPPVASLDAQQARSLALLIGTARAFDFAPPELPAGTSYVGPQLDEPAWAHEWASPWPAGDGRPLVLVAFSTTFQDHVGILQRIVDAAAGLDVRLLVTLGDTIAPDEIRPAANTVLVHSAPHDAVMPEAGLVITHGGHGTVTRALAHGKPLIVVPHGRDQNENAIRVAARGAGRWLTPGDDQATFTAAIEELLGDVRYRAAAEELGRQVAAEGRESPIVAKLEELALRASRPTRQAA